MKRWLIGGAVILAVALWIGGDHAVGTDIEKLKPAQVVWVDEAAGLVSIRTDLGHFGYGRDLASAVADMEQTAAGSIFLDTAEYLLIHPAALNRLEELTQLLRSSCAVCLSNGEADLTEVAEYLAVHKPAVTLRDLRKGERSLPILYLKEGRMYLANPSE